MYKLKELRTLFALATKGKVLEDYVTWANMDKPEYWELRPHRDVGQICMNELRLNYIKKESKCCMGRDDDHGIKCRRDIQNETPFRLSVSNKMI